MFLQKIIEAKKRETEKLKQELPLSVLREKAEKMPPARDFRKGLADSTCAIIAEIKKSSPSKGLLAGDFDPAGFAVAYAQGGAAALSVLTEKNFFAGRPEHIAKVKTATDLPVLRKDFIIEEWQVWESRVIGADAVLLISEIFEERRLRDFINVAERLGMTPLVEVHAREELKKSISAGAGVIGINNRDLGTFRTDIAASINLAPDIPPGIISVSESGIRNRADIERLLSCGFCAFLVGEALVRSADKTGKMRELLGK
ncbi:MAG: indole-3-glycerol phosphate synthase TrpC [Syntrophales bacterium]|nr:indole-3-glycerol phosphate synthase TrpC [Syntrophales bacterium]MDD5233963.1 indole-3-glycerol phosphate synthase TrpC [Syntrophales bacterium]